MIVRCFYHLSPDSSCIQVVTENGVDHQNHNVLFRCGLIHICFHLGEGESVDKKVCVREADGKQVR